MQLTNRIDKRILKARISSSTEERIVISFYKYYPIQNPQVFRDHLYIQWEKIGVLGRIYIAQEGINAQLSVPKANLEAFNQTLEDISFLAGIRRNYAVHSTHNAFFKLKMIVKDKIVADGIEDPTFDLSKGGKHLGAKEFNDLIAKDNVLLFDMRNHYESEVGHFEGAILPDVDTFREQLPKLVEAYKDKKDQTVAMYCTGGIRCEKASAYFLHHGFKEVYQLEGGVIKYAHDIQQEHIPSKFIGKNFVFDERLGERITDDIIAQCHQCGAPADTHINCANEACHLLFIQCDACAEKYHQCCSDECAHVIQLPEEEQKKLRAGVNKGRQVFKKGRTEHLPFGHKQVTT